MEDAVPLNAGDMEVAPLPAEVVMKVCSACKVRMPISEFRKKTQGGCLMVWCKKCQIEYCRNYRKRFPTAKRARHATETHVAETPILEMPVVDVPSAETSGSTLYIMRNPLLPGMIKIGRAICPVSRAQDLSKQQPFELLVSYTYAGWGLLEIFMHHKLHQTRVASGRGREWFWLEPEHADLLIRAAIVEHESIAKAQARQA